jgi:hypothetical protein
MIVSNYIERPVLVDIRVRKSRHGGASVPVVKAPIVEGKPVAENKTEPLPSQGKEQPTQALPSDSILSKIFQVQTTKQPRERPERKKEPPEKSPEKPPEEPTEEQPEEQIEKPAQKKQKTKRGVSLITKMFGSRKK